MQRCTHGQQLWQDIDAAIKAARTSEGSVRPGPEGYPAIYRALRAYFVHKNGGKTALPCLDCKKARVNNGRIYPFGRTA